MPHFERAGEGVQLSLDDQESAIMRQLVGEMRQLLGGKQNLSDPVLARLFPAAYEDADDEESYRDMVGGDLARHKARALETVAASVGEQERGGVTVELEDEAVSLWLAFLTDTRLAIGTRLGVDEERMSSQPDPRDPQAPALNLMHWLGFVQEGILRVLTDD